ncbi:restriction endonuclease subunit S [Candidatus Woesearchaeota archaeon]|nr:restriction endonuclease subunit S [Candidatus Woesearchaeota archaeon]
MTSEVPEGWIKTTLGDTDYFQILGSGIKYFQGTKEYLSTSSIDRDKIVMVEEIITHKDRPSRANMQPIQNSAWFAKMKATLKVLEADEGLIEKNILSTGFCGILSTKVDSGYLKQFLLDEKLNIIKDSKTEGTTQEAINNENTAKIEIIFPKDPKEQGKIVTILETLDKNIDKTKELIQKHQKMKRGLVLNCFSKGTKNKKTKIVKINKKECEIPEDWNVKNILKTSTLKGRIGWQGLTTAEYLNQGEYFLVTGTDFFDGSIDWNHCVYVEEKRYYQDRNIQLKIGDNLITKDGTIGKIAYVDRVPKPATLNSGVFVMRPRNGAYNPEYMHCILMSFFFDNFIENLKAGSTIAHLYQKDFVYFEFPVPISEEEQKYIASLLTESDNKIFKEFDYLNKLLKMKSGLMQDLLTGKVRVAT